MIYVLIIILQLFSSDFELLSSYTFESYCSQLFILKENGQMQFFKNTLVARSSCEKEHSNCQSKDFCESGESKDASKSQAGCNVTHFSGSNVVNQQRTVVKKAMQMKKVYILKKLKWHVACGFYRTKEETFNPLLSTHCLFCTTVFGNSNLAPGHLKNI